MSLGEGRDKWTARYGECVGTDRSPSAWVLDSLRHIPQGALVLDVAGGLGRHAIPIRRAGYRVVLLDFVASAVHAARAREPSLDAVAADAWELPFRTDTFDAIVVTNYLERALFPVFRALLGAGGHLIYETYTRDNAALVEAGVARAPRSPQYMLDPGELPRLVAPLVVVAAHEGRVEDGAGVRYVAQVVAVKR